MPERYAAPVPEPTSLRHRKQQRAREQIVAAAFELFAERGFAEVTVADIAERAEVGRTTFFRYFGDKQEVVFSHEEELISGLLDRHRDLPPPTDLADAVAQLHPVVVAICEEMTADPAHYRQHEALLRDNPELRDRAARKSDRVVEALRTDLLTRGTPPPVAELASQIALACYRAGHRAAGDDPSALPAAVHTAFTHLRALTHPPHP